MDYKNIIKNFLNISDHDYFMIESLTNIDSYSRYEVKNELLSKDKSITFYNDKNGFLNIKKYNDTLVFSTYDNNELYTCHSKYCIDKVNNYTAYHNYKSEFMNMQAVQNNDKMDIYYKDRPYEEILNSMICGFNTPVITLYLGKQYLLDKDRRNTYKKIVK